jgi:DnaJ-class molecular chaperone
MKASEFFFGLKTSIDIRTRYKRLAKKYHPDAGGSDQQMQELNLEYKKALRASLISEGKTDIEVDDIMTKENLQAADDFMKQMKNHPKGMFGFINDFQKQVEEKLKADSENGKEITASSGISAALELVFGKNPFSREKPQPGELPSADQSESVKKENDQHEEHDQ